MAPKDGWYRMLVDCEGIRHNPYLGGPLCPVGKMDLNGRPGSGTDPRQRHLLEKGTFQLGTEHDFSRDRKGVMVSQTEGPVWAKGRRVKRTVDWAGEAGMRRDSWDTEADEAEKMGRHEPWKAPKDRPGSAAERRNLVEK